MYLFSILFLHQRSFQTENPSELGRFISPTFRTINIWTYRPSTYSLTQRKYKLHNKPTIKHRITDPAEFAVILLKMHRTINNVLRGYFARECIICSYSRVELEKGRIYK